MKIKGPNWRRDVRKSAIQGIIALLIPRSHCLWIARVWSTQSKTLENPHTTFDFISRSIYMSMQDPSRNSIKQWVVKLLGHSMVTFVTKIWEFFTFNWSQLLQQTSYQSFRGWCTKYLGWSIHSNPPPQKKINLGQGQAQCPCNARWRLWLRTKVGSASESLQSPISVKCDRVLCQHLYIWWTTYC